MPTGIYDRKTKYPLKKRIICRECSNVFYPDMNITKPKRECPKCGKLIDIRDKSEYVQKYKKEHPEKWKKQLERLKEYKRNNRKTIESKTQKRTKITVLNIISGGNPHCVKCGCDDIRLLEIHHKNGGGTQEFKKEKYINYHWNIYMGRRKTDDLELYCRICHAYIHLELQYGKLPYNISYDKEVIR